MKKVVYLASLIGAFTVIAISYTNCGQFSAIDAAEKKHFLKTNHVFAAEVFDTQAKAAWVSAETFDSGFVADDYQEMLDSGAANMVNNLDTGGGTSSTGTTDSGGGRVPASSTNDDGVSGRQNSQDPGNLGVTIPNANKQPSVPVVQNQIVERPKVRSCVLDSEGNLGFQFVRSDGMSYSKCQFCQNVDRIRGKCLTRVRIKKIPITDESTGRTTASIPNTTSTTVSTTTQTTSPSGGSVTGSVDNSASGNTTNTVNRPRGGARVATDQRWVDMSGSFEVQPVGKRRGKNMCRMRVDRGEFREMECQRFVDLSAQQQRMFELRRNRERGDPLIIDVLGEESGIEALNLSAPEDGILFDIFGKRALPYPHTKARISWTKNSRFMYLALPNSTGKIHGVNELFGDNTLGPDGKYSLDGFQALSKYDGMDARGKIRMNSADGIIDKNDAIFQHLRLWADTNGNGRADSSEVKTLEDLKLIAIDLKYDPDFYERDIYGNEAVFKSVVKFENQKLGMIFDLWFTPF